MGERRIRSIDWKKIKENPLFFLPFSIILQAPGGYKRVA